MIKNALKAQKRLKFAFPYDIEKWINEMDMLMENHHKHTTWSNLVQIDSATSVEDFIRLSDKYGCKCYFSGEHGYSGEWLKMYDVCKSTLDEKIREKMKINSNVKIDITYKFPRKVGFMCL